MSNGKNGLYVTKNAPEQAPVQAPVQNQNQAQNGKFRDWEEIDISESWEQFDKKDSSYQTEYREHKELQQKLADEKRRDSDGEEIEDSALMKAVKRDMNAVSVRLEEEIPEDFGAFRELLFSTASLYDKLIKSCQDYIDGHNPWTSVGKRRKKMVEDIKERALDERRCFANAGASDNLHKDREDGMIMGNVLGNFPYLSRIEEIEGVKAEDCKEKDGHLEYTQKFIAKHSAVPDIRDVTVSREGDVLDPSISQAQAASDLMDFLGVGNLFINTQKVSIRDAQGKRHIGVKRPPEYNYEKDFSYKELVYWYQGKKLNLIFSPEALRQMSILQVMMALFGNDNYTPEDFIKFIGIDDHVSGQEVNFRVDRVYLDFDFATGIFSKDTDGDSLKKKTGSIPDFSSFAFPGLDKDFASAVLAMREGDLEFITGNLLSADHKKAFESRLKQIQKVISQRMKNEESLPQNEKTILSKEEWNDRKNLERIQSRIFNDNPQMFPGILRRNQLLEVTDERSGKKDTVVVYLHAEGASSAAPVTLKNHVDLFRKLYSRFSTIKSPEELYIAITDMSMFIQVLANEEKEDGKTRGAINDVAQRLLNEFMSREFLEARFSHKTRTALKFKEAYDAMASKVKEVPREFVNQATVERDISEKVSIAKQNAEEKNLPFDREAARKKAEKRVNEELLKQYRCYLIQQEHPELMNEELRSDGLLTVLSVGSDYRNCTYDPSFNRIFRKMDEVLKEFTASYDKEHGEGAFKAINDFGAEMDLCAAYGYLDPKKAKAATKVLNDIVRSRVAGYGLESDENGMLKEDFASSEEEKVILQGQRQLSGTLQRNQRDLVRRWNSEKDESNYESAKITDRIIEHAGKEQVEQVLNTTDEKTPEYLTRQYIQTKLDKPAAKEDVIKELEELFEREGITKNQFDDLKEKVSYGEIGVDAARLWLDRELSFNKYLGVRGIYRSMQTQNTDNLELEKDYKENLHKLLIDFMKNSGEDARAHFQNTTTATRGRGVFCNPNLTIPRVDPVTNLLNNAGDKNRLKKEYIWYNGNGVFNVKYRAYISAAPDKKLKAIKHFMDEVVASGLQDKIHFKFLADNDQSREDSLVVYFTRGIENDEIKKLLDGFKKRCDEDDKGILTGKYISPAAVRYDDGISLAIEPKVDKVNYRKNSSEEGRAYINQIISGPERGFSYNTFITDIFCKAAYLAEDRLIRKNARKKGEDIKLDNKDFALEMKKAFRELCTLNGMDPNSMLNKEAYDLIKKA